MSEPGHEIPRTAVESADGLWKVYRIPAGARGSFATAVFGKPVTREDFDRLLDEDDDQ